MDHFSLMKLREISWFLLFKFREAACFKWMNKQNINKSFCLTVRMDNADNDSTDIIYGNYDNQGKERWEVQLSAYYIFKLKC